MNCIWFNKDVSLETLEQSLTGTMAENLDMEWEEIGDNYLRMKMPVTDKSRQPYGILHGGASCALAETIGSIGSHLVIDNTRFRCVGLEINANHVSAVNEGIIYAIAKPLHLGRSTHIWDIRITSGPGKLVCVSRLTVAILEKQG
ncbi:MAG: PaaI family thioesterase [Ferruginibacter sp.]